MIGIARIGRAVTGACAAWRRSRAARQHQLPSSLDDFFDWLAATPYRWYLRPDGRLRTRDGGVEICAIVAVARHRRGRIYSVGDWIHAGESIGLSAADAALIVVAADHSSSGRLAARLRQRLLIVARIADRGCKELPAHRRRPRAPSSLSTRMEVPEELAPSWSNKDVLVDAVVVPYIVRRSLLMPRIEPSFTLERLHVDLDGAEGMGTLCLDPGSTKNDDARVVVGHAQPTRAASPGCPAGDRSSVIRIVYLARVHRTPPSVFPRLRGLDLNQ
jgi:hypothetical protein